MRKLSYIIAVAAFLPFWWAPIRLHAGPRFPTQAQRDTALHRVAAFKHLGFQVVAARLKLGIDTALAWRQLDTLLAKPTGDIFWMYPAAGFYFNCKDLLNDYWRDRFRKAWKRYTPYRGDTENHFLMYYSTLLLFSQEWPDMTEDEWFNGKSSRENYAEAKEYLNHWVDETVAEGTTEWDSPRYLYYYLTPLVLLRDFTHDATMQRRFEMMLEYQLADFAAEYLNGSYCGAHSRDGDGSVIDPRKAECSSYAGLYFEDSLSLVLPDLAYAAMSTFQCPQIIRGIAHDREKPFTHMEWKRSRAKMRFSRERYTPVFKVDYMTPDYCLGSMQGGLQQPIQQHSWDVTFASGRPNNTIFALHPNFSATELGTFFPEEPELMLQGITQAKASYTNENKWIGGSPYERLFQFESTLIGLYAIPADVPVKHVDFFLPKSLDTIVRDPSGWIFARMEGAFVGVRLIDPRDPTRQPASTWTEEGTNWRLRAAGDTLGYIVECGSKRTMGFAEFRERLVRQAFTIARGRNGSTISYHSPFHWYPPELPVSGDPGVLGPYPYRYYSNYQVPFDGPHLRQGRGSMVLEMRYHGRKRVLDFRRNLVTERGGKQVK